MGLKLSAAIAAAAAIAALSGCGSLASSAAPAGQPSSSPSAVATSGLCTTSACIVSDAQRSAVGIIADDKSVVTKAVCKPSTVKRNPGGTFTVTCTVTYSDGMVARGYANLVPAQDKFTFEPTAILKQ